VNLIGEFVLVRTYSAGVHMGTLAESAGTAVMLTDARRLWRWKGANTLHEVSLHGVGNGSRISEPVPVILLTQATEILPCSAKAQNSLQRSRWDD
jgi:hypothetical protein